MRAIFFSLALVLVTLEAAPAAAVASIAGTIRDDVSAGIPGMEVRLWGLGSKGYNITYTVLSDGSGNYSFTGVADNLYKLDARMPATYSGNYGDRWYDVLAPNAGGWVGSDADEITLNDGDNFTGYDITLLVLGGLDACVVNGGGVPLQNLQVRVEMASDRRVHHNDLTKNSAHPTREGCFYMRGMVPAADYRIIISDPTGVYGTVVLEGPYAIVSGANTNAGSITLTANPAVDPYEDNDSAADTNANSIAGTIFEQVPPQSFTTTGAFVGVVPDLDWYCFQAQAGARFIVTIDAFLDLGAAGIVDHPFFDPVVGFWSETANDIIAANDDEAAGVWDSRLAAEAIAGAGRYCVVVTSYPDLTFAGSAPGSTGTYVLTVTPTNRRPLLAATRVANPVPPPPAMITIAEDEPITLDLTFSDPDGDALVVLADHDDNLGAEVGEAVFNVGAGVADWSWTPSQVAAAGSPYTVTFTATDAELTATVTVLVEVTGVNVPPTLPTHLWPPTDIAVTTLTPELRIVNSTDMDLNPLAYEYELYEGLVVDLPARVQTGTVFADASGQTVWQPAALLENTWYSWRVRAYDGQTDNPYSAWTLEWHFFVDVANDPPAAPTMTKPVEGQLVLVRAPTLEATNPSDPEDDPLDMYFEVATDDQFTSMTTASPAVPVSGPVNGATTWQTNVLLDWSGAYSTRAYVIDARGGVSPYSNVISFALRDNQPPPKPELAAPYDVGCEGGVEVSYPLAAIRVNNIIEPDNDPVWIDLEIYRADEPIVPENALANLREEQLPATTTTSFAVGSGNLQEGDLYLVRASADDTFVHSAWDVCWFVAPAGGGSAKGGCGCAGTGVDALAALAALWLVRRRRRG